MTLTTDEALAQLRDATSVYLTQLRRLRPALGPYADKGPGLLDELAYAVDRALEPADGTPTAIRNVLEELRQKQ